MSNTLQVFIDECVRRVINSSRVKITRRLPGFLFILVVPLVALLVGIAELRAAASTAIAQPSIVINAVLYDGYELFDADEAVRLRNVGGEMIDLNGWQVSDGGTTTAVISGTLLLAPNEAIWLTNDNIAFTRQFGFAADVQLDDWPGFANTGDEVLLLNPADQVVDLLVYKGGDVTQVGWLGAAVEPYKVTGVFGEEGQILYRRRDLAMGRPVVDSNQAADWAQMSGDTINGRKVLYPGWDATAADRYFFTRRITATAMLTVVIAPDNAYETLVAHINRAQTTVQLASLTFEHIGLGEALAAAAQRGVDVTILLEGAPVGGLPDQEKYVCQQIEAAGGACWFMGGDEDQRIFDRYRFMHAKYLVIDGRIAAISSENMSPNSMPDDDKSDGTWGRRGVVLLTDAPEIVEYLAALFAEDLDQAHVDIFRWQADHPTYGTPQPGFVPIRANGGITYTVRFPQAAVFRGTWAMELVQSPENSLRPDDGLLGLVGRAGEGDTLLVQQLSERPYWGATTSNPLDDPNPRLEAYIAAARRGARVKLLLDSFFLEESSAVSNAVTCDYVNSIARSERLRLSCELVNPTGLGLHNKMVLAEIDGRGYIHVGSLNGTELSNKGNREVALQVQSDEAYDLLADLFVRDTPAVAYLPTLFQNFQGAANHVLISEVLYDPPGADDAEFIELANPTIEVIDLTGYRLGDAVNPTDFEDMRFFPPGVSIAPRGTLVVATAATAFLAQYGRHPDLEIIDSDAAVPDMVDDPAWGDPEALLQLGNMGDEIILLGPNGEPVDVVAYGVGSYPGVVSCALVPAFNQSLERFPYWRDTDDCAVDFRPWPFPNPGVLP